MMANPRRNSYSIVVSEPFQAQTTTSTTTTTTTRRILSSVTLLLKKPHGLLFVLSALVLLTWISLRLQHSSSAHFSSPPHLNPDNKWTTNTPTHPNHDDDYKVNLLRFYSSYPSPITKDKRGWLLNPFSLPLHAPISGGAVNCSSLHLGEIQPGGVRGNHRHYTCNETFLIWGAKTIFRLENDGVDRGYAEVTIGADEVAVAASPRGRMHVELMTITTETTTTTEVTQVEIWPTREPPRPSSDIMLERIEVSNLKPISNRWNSL